MERVKLHKVAPIVDGQSKRCLGCSLLKRYEKSRSRKI